MKIDIHTHTKRCKSGDAPTREVTPEQFVETILSTDVGIVAITNHNHFDYEQYKSIEKGIGKMAQVWPGVELDIVENEMRGHLLVIASPVLVKQFSERVHGLIDKVRPDNFTTTIDEVLETFDALNPLYVAHYKQKKPSLPEEALEKLLGQTKNPSFVIKEVTNSISAGIYISHGHASIYGSDLQDWAEYEELSPTLPELRLPVDSFEQFCLLLKKDPTTINTVLNKKTSEDLVLCPFDDGTTLKLKAYNDINVIFGPKGTGKSCILNSIEKHYADNGVDTTVYKPASDRLDEIFDTKGRKLTINLNNFGIEYCTDEIKHLRSAAEISIASLNKYRTFFETKATNKNAKKIRLKDIEPEKVGGSRREFVGFHDAVRKTEDFLSFLREDPFVKKALKEKEYKEIDGLLSNVLTRLRSRRWTSFITWKVIELLNSAIEKVRSEIERKAGAPAKPTTTGFHDYAINRIKLEHCASKIVNGTGTPIPVVSESVGNLGSNKGELEFRTELVFQTGGVTDGQLKALPSAPKKTTQKDFINCVHKILQHAFSDDLFEHISDLNDIEGGEDIKTIQELLLFNRYFALDGVPYSPSSGEAAMVMLQKELGTDREVYILDEPERSLGNEYISEVIVPLLKQRARTGKKVFLSTHDANIAVRTLPYSSIYRCHDSSGYKTYSGNPFSNDLVNIEDQKDQLDWKKVSMRTLEGGEEAFGERGKIYGND